MEKKLESNIRDILSPGNSWKRRKDARPPEIIEAARAVLERTGAKGLSMNKISKEAGVQKRPYINILIIKMIYLIML